MDTPAFEPSDLVGWHVVEIGLRQAWPFLVFANPASGAEVRLYIDTVFRVEANKAGDDQAARLQALGCCLMLTVDAASVAADGGLRVRLEGIELVVEGEGATFTTHDVWSLREIG